MSDQTSIELKFALTRLVDTWRSFCELHTNLYEFTCDEYMHLLASEIDELDETVTKKTALLKDINLLDGTRSEITNEIMAYYKLENEPKKLKVLIQTLRDNGEAETAKQVESMNLILLDIVEKIQEQNKKNQVFLNKAIHSLQDLRESFAGKAKFKTYSSSGSTRSNSTL